MNKGKLFVFTGPSGTGKGTMLSQVMQQTSSLKLSVSATTRAPRQGEEHGIHYWFMSPKEFEDNIAQDAFLEYANYVGNYYGTPEQPVNVQLDEGYDVILEIEVQGAMQIKKKRPDAVMIFVAPPSLTVLEERLRGRGTEEEEKITARLEQAKTELDCQNAFDYVIVNDKLDDAILDFQAIIRAEHCRIQ